jgi:hypothetical protein
VGFGLHAVALDLLLVLGRDCQRQLAREQEVARVTVRHLDDFAAATQVLHVLLENDFN